MNYNRFINPLSSRRPHYALRDIPKLYANAPPGSIFMGGGLPNASTFPFTKFEVEVGEQNIKLEGKKLVDALQYQSTPGYTPLIEQLKELQTKVHGLDSKFWETRDLLVTTGGMEGLCRAVEMCIQEGDPFIMQEPSYPGMMAMLRPYNPRMILAVQDEFGICPDKLRATLESEGTPQMFRERNTGVPKLMYVNPSGTNPTGATIPTQRKREIYKIACEFDFLILEDDPYYHLQFEKDAPVSFLSMDTEGRVLRFDSFSKILSAGIRLGFMTAPKKLSERIELHMEISKIHTSGLSQVLVDSLLREWQFSGLERHFAKIQTFYKKQRDSMIAAVSKHLTGLAEWTVPTAGMFLWIRVLGVDDVRDMVQKEGIAKGVILVSGHHFMWHDKAPCSYIRASYGTATEEDMYTGFSRLADIIKSERIKLIKITKTSLLKNHENIPTYVHTLVYN